MELGFGLPWFAIALHRVPSPAQRIYPGRHSLGLDTGDRKTDRAYVLHADDPAAVAAVLGGPLRGWLPGALATRPEQRPLITLEVSGGWAMTAIQAGGLAVPDAVALSRQRRLGHPGPWPDALLSLLAAFREHVPAPAPAGRSPDGMAAQALLSIGTRGSARAMPGVDRILARHAPPAGCGACPAEQWPEFPEIWKEGAIWPWTAGVVMRPPHTGFVQWEARMRLGTFLLVAWLVVGAFNGSQRHYYEPSDENCAGAGK